MAEANRNPADYGENRGRGKLALYSSVCLLTHCSHRVRGPREKDCSQFPLGQGSFHHVLALQAPPARR